LRSPKNAKALTGRSGGDRQKENALTRGGLPVHRMDREKSAEVIVVVRYEPLQIKGGLTATMKD
jgi:hypothetical protein